MGLKFTRRALLSAIPLGLAAQTSRPTSPAPTSKKNKPLPAAGEFSRLTDGVTENVIVRLTNPAFVSQLTALGNQFVSLKERTLIFSSNRTGRMTPFQVDLRSGVLKQITEADKLEPRSLCLDHTQKSAYFLDEDKLRLAPLDKRGGGAQTLTDGVTWFRTDADGRLFAITEGKLVRREGASWKAIADSAIACWPRPDGAGSLFARKAAEETQEFWYVPLSLSGSPVLIASGKIRDPFWDTDGQSILFLRDVANASSGVVQAEIHSRSVNGEPEKCVAKTSQFATFAPNGNGSVFVGASRSHAQPNVVLLLRSPSREMTLCEHGSKHPGDVLPAFSPDSRRVYFESDKQGNPAIYSVNVEYLVEPVASEGGSA